MLAICLEKCIILPLLYQWCLLLPLVRVVKDNNIWMAVAPSHACLCIKTAVLRYIPLSTIDPAKRHSQPREDPAAVVATLVRACIEPCEVQKEARSTARRYLQIFTRGAPRNPSHLHKQSFTVRHSHASGPQLRTVRNPHASRTNRLHMFCFVLFF